MEIVTTAGGSRTAYGWASGDNPGIPDFVHEVPPEIAKVVMNAVSEAWPKVGAILGIHALQSGDHVVGRYHVHAECGEYFTRVSSLRGHPELERSLTHYLNDKNIPVADLLAAGHALEWRGDNFRLDVRTFLSARHFQGSDGELAAVAAVVRDCHEALRDFPGRNEVHTLASARFQELKEAAEHLHGNIKAGHWDRITPYPEWVREEKTWLQELIENFAPRFDLLPGAQCLHGQIHRANVVYRLSDSSPVLLDFEDAVHVFAPPSWDLAYLVQRFCLYESEHAQRRIRIVSENYGSFGPEVFTMMRQIAWLSIVILSKAWMEKGVRAPLAEFQKFAALERDARKWEG